MAETFVESLTRLLEEATRENEGLKVQLAAAPHGLNCGNRPPDVECYCWKSKLAEDALSRVESRVLLRAANEIAEIGHEGAAGWLKNRAERL